MKKVIKHPKKMKNAMYIVFGVFALALFAITRIHPIYANEGLMIDDALDAIVLYGEVDQLPEDEEVEEVQDEEIQEIEKNQEVEEDEDIVEPEETSNEEINEEDKISENLDEAILERDSKEIDKTENKEEPQDKEENHGVSYENIDNEAGQEEQKVEKEEIINENKEKKVETPEEFGFRAPENIITEDAQPDIIESEEIYGTGEYEGVKVEVYAASGLFESGTVLTIEPVIEENLKQVKEVLLPGEQITENEENQTVIAFDITFKDPTTQEELQPKDGRVQVTFNYENNEDLKAVEEDEEQAVKVYHLNDIDEEGNKIEELTGTIVEEVAVNEEKSEEENVIVVDAESFSIYALIGARSTVTVTYNANGGVFNNNEEELVVTYTNYKPNINVQTPNRNTDNPSSQSGWMFAGWYTTQTNQVTEWLGQSSDTTTSSKTVYAKWLPFNDYDLGIIGLTGIKIMDRNLGAESIADGTYYDSNNGHEDYSKLGYYYQWGNNYGFKNNGSVSIRDGYYNKVDGDTYGPNNYFSNSQFIKQYQGYPPYRWTINDNRNLWGGENSTNPDSDKQGPCPNGYHVPDTIEWKLIYNSYTSIRKQNNDFCEGYGEYSIGGCFVSKLKLPYAGQRYYTDASINYRGMYGNYGNYWSSSPYSNDNNAYYMTVSDNSIFPQSNNYRVYGYSVRCLKNFEAKKISFFKESGEKVSEIEKRWIDSISYNEVPNNLVKEGYEFIGWYESGSNEEYDFSQPTTKNIMLYAKWINREGFIESESAKFAIGKKVNSIMKTLSSGNFVDFSQRDYLIRGIERSQILPQGGNKKLISSEDSETPIIAWYDTDSQKILYYSNAENLYLNEDSSYMFSNLKNLESLDMNQFKTDYVINMERMFDNSFSSLEGLSLDFTNLNLSSVENMSYMFNYISDGYNSSVNISGVTIDFSNTIMNNVKTMKGMFYFSFYSVDSTNGLKINFNNAKMNSVTDMSQMFYEIGYNTSNHESSWSGLTIDFSNAKMGMAKDMSKMFHYAFYTVNNLSNINIDFSNTDMKNVENMEEMFFEFGYGNSRNSGILSGVLVNFSNSKMNNVTNMKKMFYAALKFYESSTNIEIKFTNSDFYNQDTEKLINMQSMFNSFCGSENSNDSLKGVKIDFSNLDLSRVENMSDMFQYAFTVKKNIYDVEINFGQSNLSSVKNMEHMFRSFGSMSTDIGQNISGVKIDFSKTKLNNVENMSEMFYFALSYSDRVNNIKIDFSNADFSNGDTNKSLNMARMFNNFFYGNYNNPGSMSGVDIDFGGANMSRIINMNEMFNYSFVNYKDISDVIFNFSETIFDKPTNMQRVFYYTFYGRQNVSGLNVDFSKANLNGISNMSEMFYEFLYGKNGTGDIKGVNINFSGAEMSNIVSMQNMFYYTMAYGKSVSDVKIDFSNVDFNNSGSNIGLNMYQMFYETFYGYEMELLSGVTIDFNGANLSRVDNMSNMFCYFGAYAGEVENMKIDFSKANFGNSGSNIGLNMYQMFYEAFYGYGTELLSGIKIDFNGANLSRVDNMGNMFYYFGAYAGEVENMKIDFSKANFGNVKNMNQMFYDFGYQVESVSGVLIDLNGVDMSSVNTMYQMFAYIFGEVENENLTGVKVYLDNIITKGSITNMLGMFNGCGLKDLDLRAFNTSNVIVMNNMFNNCSNLTRLDLSSFDTNKVTDMGNMFNGNEKLKTIYVGDKFILNSGVNSGNMFNGAISLVGGNGTAYSGNKIDGEYARIDTDAISGYFTNILDKPYTITYHTNEGILSGEKTTYTQRDSFTLPVPIRTGYTFLGWTGSNGLEPEITVNIAEFTVGDLEYTANWGIGKYKIIFDTDGGNALNPIDVNYNSVIPNLPTPTKECNAFSGWDAELPETMPAHDITLKAIWEYTCSRSSGGGGGAKKSESTTREIAIDTPTDQEHNSANEEQKTETSSNSENTNNQEIGQEIAIDGGTQKTVVVRNTDIVATVRNTTHSSSSRFTKEENDAYSFAKSNGITTTDSIDNAKMNTELTRIQMAKMLSNFAINVLGQEPDISKGTIKFNDVTNKMDDQYDNAVIKAYQLGIMGQNMKNNEFRPNDEVTRAEFASALSRLLYQTEEGEYRETSKYYIPHVAKLYNEGIINKTDPKIKEKRGYVMTMLMRTVQ